MRTKTITALAVCALALVGCSSTSPSSTSSPSHSEGVLPTATTTDPAEALVYEPSTGETMSMIEHEKFLEERVAKEAKADAELWELRLKIAPKKLSQFTAEVDKLVESRETLLPPNTKPIVDAGLIYCAKNMPIEVLDDEKLDKKLEHAAEKYLCN